MAFPPLYTPSWVWNHHRLATGSNLDPAMIRQGLARYTSDDPEISIVVPAYNEGLNLLRMLSSLSQLTLPLERPTELLVVDDGSTDGTEALLQDLGVSYVRLETNQSVRVARQKGLEACKGEIVLQADADSVYPVDWGRKYVQILESTPSVAMVYGGHSFLPDPRTNRLMLALHEMLGNVARQVRRRHRAYINTHGFNSALRRSQGLEYGSYEHDSLGSEDGEMAFQLAKLGELRYCPDSSCRVWTSPRRLLAHGGLLGGSVRRIKRELRRSGEYLTGRKQKT